MTQLILRGVILVPSADLDAVNAEPINHLRLTQAEVGCVTFEVSQCEINPLRFEVYEVFTDKVAF
ncbi:antibiotic biosynthesis monooxygenase [Agarivorans sp. TSD2052]|uniref:putative quinol monooxygenase n=1 Tax=Agarivorans sp. TSD2052 TaxID=2937286 RepID=UPI00200BB54F|nr:antibiotic biosynthesis monooxygenase [Agarivorans sp. TSD2052]UPW17027.1 antibiotic biosynthesis monooxygenase [Agarivorans sp. TSD2052]